MPLSEFCPSHYAARIWIKQVSVQGGSHLLPDRAGYEGWCHTLPHSNVHEQPGMSPCGAKALQDIAWRRAVAFSGLVQKFNLWLIVRLPYSVLSRIGINESVDLSSTCCTETLTSVCLLYNLWNFAVTSQPLNSSYPAARPNHTFRSAP